LEAFGGGAKADERAKIREIFHDGGESGKEEEEKKKEGGKRLEEKIVKERRRATGGTNGIEQIFMALSALRKAAIDGILSRRMMKEEKGEGHNPPSTISTTPSPFVRKKREIIIGGKKHDGKKRENGQKMLLDDWHRLEGEPCSPGHVCQNGTVCEDGHCKCHGNGVKVINCPSTIFNQFPLAHFSVVPTYSSPNCHISPNQCQMP
jgi:hypothetical protein